MKPLALDTPRRIKVGLAAEHCWEQTKNPMALLYSAQMWELIGDPGRVLSNYDAYKLGRAKLSRNSRHIMEDMERRARAQAAVVRVTFEGLQNPANASVAGEIAGTEGPLASSRVESFRGDGDLWLSPGRWSITILREGQEACVERFDVARPDAEAKVPLRLKMHCSMVVPEGPGKAPPPRLARVSLLIPVSRGDGSYHIYAYSAMGYQPLSQLAIENEPTEWTLPAGPWDFEVSVPGYRTTVASINVSPGERYSVRFTPRNRVGLLLAGMLVLSGVAAGVPMAVIGDKRHRAVRDKNEQAFQSLMLASDALDDVNFHQCAPNWTNECQQISQITSAYSSSSYHKDLKHALQLESAGVAVSGLGLGAVLGESLGRERPELLAGLGVNLLLGGAIWLGVHKRYRERDLSLYDPSKPDSDWRIDRQDVISMRAQELTASGLLGLGLGMFVGAGSYLFGEKLKARVTPEISRQTAGLSLSGAF